MLTLDPNPKLLRSKSSMDSLPGLKATGFNSLQEARQRYKELKGLLSETSQERSKENAEPEIWSLVSILLALVLFWLLNTALACPFAL